MVPCWPRPVWSALAIVFAESVSDFGVAATLANDAHFPVATFTLYNAVDSFPVHFPVAAAIGWVLLAMAGLALLAQTRALRGRSYRVLGGRSRPARRQRLSPLATGGRRRALIALLIVVGLGVPAFGAVSASLIDGLGSLGGTHGLRSTTTAGCSRAPTLQRPAAYSAELATITATVTTVLGARRAPGCWRRGAGRSAGMLDLLLLTAVALPGIVFAAGYIFTYNLPLTNTLGIHLYETTTLLVLAYIATALPVDVAGAGRHDQPDAGFHAATRRGSTAPARPRVLAAHRAAGPRAPAARRPGSSPSPATLLELPVSQLLLPAGTAAVSVGITMALATTTSAEARPWRSSPSCSPSPSSASPRSLFRLLARRAGAVWEDRRRRDHIDDSTSPVGASPSGSRTRRQALRR